MKFIRPKRVIITYTDPFDGTLLCINRFAYNARLSADGFYTNSVRVMREGLKKIQSHILRGRSPAVNIRYEEGKS